MSRTKEYFHEEIEEQYRREFIEEPEIFNKDKHSYIISVTAPTIREIYNLLMEVYKDIKSGEVDAGETSKNKDGKTLSYGFRKI